MRKTWIMMWVLGLGCASTGEPDSTVEEFLAVDSAQSSGVQAQGSPPPQVRAPAQLPDSEDTRWTTTHYNLTIQVDHPAEALGRARAVLLEGSAAITNSSRQPDSATLNATVGPQTYANLLAAVGELGGAITSENSSQSNTGIQVRQLRERLELAQRADAQLSGRLEGVHGDDLDALMFLHELTARERQNLENQIRSYWDQAGKTYVYLTFQRRSG
ncbi:MAG: hypothetical protein ACRBN8_09400 [Nannocystales bacterium]